VCKGIVVYFPLNRNSYERFFPIRDTLSMVQKKAAWNGQGDRQSKVVEQFASGFVATSSATEAEKSAQRDWDRSKLLAVNADDPQSAIYEQISVRSNMSAEGGTTRRGLGCGADSGSTSAHAQYRRGVSFVSAGGAPAPLFVPKSGVASTPASGMPHQAPGDQGSLPQGSLPQGSLPQGSLPQGWVSAQAPTGALYYVNTSTGVTQWEPPTALPPLPPGWVEGRDPNSGIAYYANPSTGQTQWERPAAQLPPSAPPPPPPPLPPPDEHALATMRWASGSKAAVRVSGVPSSMSEPDLKELFAPFGHVSSIEMRSGYSAGTGPKSALLKYDTLASAELAVKQMHGTKMRSNKLEVVLEEQGLATATATSSARYRPY